MIVPHWEWRRTFGEAFGEAEERLAELAPTRMSDSDELYVGWSSGGPVAKAEFPIAAADVASLLSELGVAAPPLGRDAYELYERESKPGIEDGNGE
jgi:hypothetical protein